MIVIDCTVIGRAAADRDRSDHDLAGLPPGKSRVSHRLRAYRSPGDQAWLGDQVAQVEEQGAGAEEQHQGQPGVEERQELGHVGVVRRRRRLRTPS